MRQSKTFWMWFIVLSVIFLTGWYFYWEIKSGHIGRMLPVSEELQGDLATVVRLARSVIDTNGEERVFLVVFQNNMELRPGGGFIGSFGILKIKDGKVTDFQLHDSINFDGRIPDTVAAPYPFWETLKVKWLKLRDANISPDWATNADQLNSFYRLGGGTESFDGIIGITTNVLTSFLTITGPVKIDGYPGEYGADRGVLDLEYQVEQGFVEQGISRADRKNVMELLGKAILERVKQLSLQDQYRLFRVALDDLHKKDIQLFFWDERLQSIVNKAGWSGNIDREWKQDSLLLVDSNMSALKTDLRMKRSLDYVIDLRGESPKATATVTYEHTAKEKDFMTRDYQSYTRLYVPEGAWIESVEGSAKHSRPAVFGSELGRKYAGVIVQVPLGTTRTLVFEYGLPKTIAPIEYDLKIEKQPGVNDMPITVTVYRKNGSEEQHAVVLNRPFVLSRTR